jgi:hypothetical protein
MLKLTQSPTFWSEVDVELSREEGGKPHTFKFDQQFPRLTSPQIKAVNDFILSTKADDDEVATLLALGGWVDIVPWADDEKKPEGKPVMKWRRVVAEDETTVPLNAETFTQLLRIVGCGSAICRTFFKEIRRAATGN